MLRLYNDCVQNSGDNFKSEHNICLKDYQDVDREKSIFHFVDLN